MSKQNKFLSFNRRWFLRGLAFAGSAALTSNFTQLESLVRAQTNTDNSTSPLKELESIPNSDKPLKFVILGAGMAGLSAAYELEKLGHTCVILEAEKSHIGGRVRTLRFEDGLYGDVGAMRIPKTHNLTRHYINLCDLPIATTYYPNDNASAKDPDVSAGPGVILAAYAWGSQARYLGNLLPEERHAVVQQGLGLIHPQINEDGVLRRMESWNWDNHPWSLAGFAFFKPYQQTGLYKDTIAPEGRIYFAGEHTSTQYAWIEGALISSVRAV